MIRTGIILQNIIILVNSYMMKNMKRLIIISIYLSYTYIHTGCLSRPEHKKGATKLAAPRRLNLSLHGGIELTLQAVRKGSPIKIFSSIISK
jgi:hypothetical protein